MSDLSTFEEGSLLERSGARRALAVLTLVVLAVFTWLLGPGTPWWLEHVDGVKFPPVSEAPGRSPAPKPTTSPPVAEGMSEADKDRMEALDKARGRIAAYGTGVLALIAIGYTASNARSARRNAEAAIKVSQSSEQTTQAAFHSAEAAMRTAAATEQGLVTGRYTAAIEQLGSDKLDIRLGGVYALERIARDSERDHPTVMAVLAAFVREHSHDPDAHTSHPAGPAGPSPDSGGAPQPRARFRPDLQGALTVIGRRNTEHDTDRINLSGADLRAAQLHDANLSRVNFRGVNLVDADLDSADLHKVDFYEADLQGACLIRVDLHDAYLHSADLRGANLASANLAGANLARANLHGAHMIEADLANANLIRADLGNTALGGANLNGTYLNRSAWRPNLEGADLRKADLRDSGLSVEDARAAGGWVDESTLFGSLPSRSDP